MEPTDQAAVIPAMSRRSLLKTAAVGAFATIVPLSACSSDNGRTQLRFEETKPEVVTYFDQLVADFNKSQSRIEVTHDSTSSLIASFVRGDPPDLDCDNYNLTTSIFIARGVLSDLANLPQTKLIDPNVQALVSQYATYKGETNVLPYSVAGAGVIYNPELFDKHGVGVPRTWSELIAACETFKSKGVTPIYATFKDPWTIQQGLFDYVSGSMINVAGFYKALTLEGSNVGPDSAVSFQKTFMPAVDKMIQLTKYMNSDAPSRAYADGNAAFASGEGAMYLQGPWAIGEVATANPKLKVATFPLPSTDNPRDTKVRVNLDLALWIPTSTSKRAAAIAFLTYLMQPSVMYKYNTQNLAFSPVKNPPPVKDERIAGLEPYVRSGRFYQGAGTYVPNVIPIGNYLQEMVLSGNGKQAMVNLDNDWARLAKRTA